MKRKIVSILLSATMFLGAVGLSACAPTEAEYVIPEVSINADGELIFTFPDGTVKNAGVVKGADGLNGKDGADGINGADGKDGANGKDGKDGANGINGTGIASAEINENGELVITYTDQTTANLGVVKGADGVNGENGKDGANGINGTGIASAEINENGELVITYTDETTANLGVVKGSNGADGSEITIGECGHWFINGEDTFYRASDAERDVIKITDETVPFTEESQEKITIKNVPKTDKVFDEKNFEGSIDHNEDGSIKSMLAITNDISDVYALYDMVCRNETYPYNGILMLPDTSGLGYLHPKFTIRYNPDSHRFYVETAMEGAIKFEDEREYRIKIQFNSSLILELMGGDLYYDMVVNPQPQDVYAKYVCFDGKVFLKESVIEIPEIPIYTGVPNYTHIELAIKYDSANERNPYEDELNTYIFDGYYHSAMAVHIYDSDKYTDNGTLTGDEAALAFGQIYETIKDCFIVYDYDYYGKQFDEEFKELENVAGTQE